MTTTDKVQVGESTTGTSTSTTWKSSSPPPTEYGWACPRCGKINAPWKSQCDCAGGYWYPTWGFNWDYREPWWKQIYCNSDTFKVHPESTTWKAPSTMCGSDSSSTYKSDSVTTAWNANSAMDTGGSDYWNSCTRAWENGPKTDTNQLNNNSNSINNPWEHLFNLTEQFTQLQNEIDNLKEKK